MLLPPLREDLQLMPAAPNRDGSPAWMVLDPVGNRFFRIGWLEFEILSRWALRNPSLIARAVREDTPLAPTSDDVLRVAAFFRHQQLVRVSDPAGVAELARMAASSRTARWKWLLHNYLFFRIPLVRPQGFLEAVAPWCSVFYTRGFAFVAIAAALLGVALAMRQWDVFVATFADFFSPSGLLGYALALSFAKTLHELGHAVTATRLGVRVAHMGVAFLVMYPMLYTDTGESWKLPDRRDRFRIAAAGMATEFVLAGFATLAWSLVDDGAARSALFFLATTSWVLTLGINASPFMRFDGYFLLSDALDLPNLHARSFALARAALRRNLLGWHEPDPEHFTPGLRRFLVGFALLTWVYRLIVFAGIAVAVYLFFFKALGIFLFLVEIAWFIVRPVWAELRVWGERRAETSWTRRFLLLAVLGAVIAFLALPWRSGVRGEAWVHAAQHQAIYSPFAARVVELRDDGPVRRGEPLVVLDSPDTRGQANQTRAAAEALMRELAQSVGRVDGAERYNMIAEQLARQLAELDAQRDELQRLRLSAGFDGLVVDRDAQIRPGTWVSANQPIAVLIDPTSWLVEALIGQRDLDRIRVGQSARFYVRGDPRAPLHGRVEAIDSARAQTLPDPMLAAENGGHVPASRSERGQWVPRDVLYRVRIRLDASPPAVQSRAGTVVIDGVRRSLLGDWFESVAAVVVRESGF